MKFRKSDHGIYKTEYHLVWIPRYRRKVFVKGVKEYAEKLLSHIPELDPNIEVVKLNVQMDHVHMVVVIPSRLSVSDLMETLKGKTAISLFKSMPDLKKKPYWGNHFWSRGYAKRLLGLMKIKFEGT